MAAVVFAMLTLRATGSAEEDAKLLQPADEGGSKTPTASRSANVLSIRSAHGAYFASATKDGKVKYGRVSDGVVLRVLYHCCPVALAFSADGKILATAGGCDQQKTIKLWRLGDGQMLARLPNDGEAQCLAFSPDDQFLVCHNRNSQIKLWHLPNRELKWSMTLLARAPRNPKP